MNSSKLLVVDDEPHIVDLLRGYLECEGYDVSVASDGPTALGLVRDLKPDLIVLDLMLPGLDGIEVCRQLRQFSDAYVLMLTARSEEVDKIVGLTVGADERAVLCHNLRESGSIAAHASGEEERCWEEGQYLRRSRWPG